MPFFVLMWQSANNNKFLVVLSANRHQVPDLEVYQTGLSMSKIHYNVSLFPLLGPLDPVIATTHTAS